MQPENSLILETWLRNQGLHITAQRRVILDVLRTHGQDLTAEEIYAEARKTNSHINLATVYRTLSKLRQAGVVEQYYVSPDHSEGHFQLTNLPLTINTKGKQWRGERFHFRCLGCGKISEIVSSELVDFVSQIVETQANGAQLTQICMCAEGYCPACARNQDQA